MDRYGIASWNYQEPGADLAALIREFAACGFDTVSFLPSQVTGLSSAQRLELARTIEALNLGVTVHGSCHLAETEARCVTDTFGARLLNFTLDPLMWEDSRWTVYDGVRISAALRLVLAVTAGLPTRVGVEDFPLDAEAYAHYRGDLGALLENERAGILMDVGHMYLRMKRGYYFARMSSADYIARLPLRIIEIHVHDNNGTKDEHGHIGFGSVPFPAVAAGLKAVGFNGVSTIEVAPALHGSRPEMSKPLAIRSLEQWRRLLAGR